MLRVERHLVTLPAEAVRRLSAAHTDARKFFKATSARSQKRFPFKKDAWQEARETLRDLFYDTCCYCESRSSQLSVDHFRPVTEAANLDGTSDSDWYWWLAYKWENLYLVCADCIQNKSNLFPVIGNRLGREQSYSGGNSESYLLLDPCFDDPCDFLRFMDDGTVQDISQPAASGTPSRGAITIEILGLNRTDLVRQRRQVAEQAHRELMATRPTRRVYDADELRTIRLLIEKVIDEYDAFVAAKRHLAARFLIQHPSLRRNLNQKHPAAMRRIDKDLRKYLDVEERFLRKPKTSAAGKKKRAPVKEEVTISYDNVYIKRIQIKNFRNIESLDLTLKAELADSQPAESVDAMSSPTTPFHAGWKMLLGENGAGKSSVLKAVALALMGEAFYHDNKFANRLEEARIFKRGATAKSGLIKLTLSKGDPIEVRFTKTRLKFKTGAEGAKGTFVRGYGSARLFGQPASSPTSTKPPEVVLKKVANLLHPEEVLSHPIEWIQSNLDTLDSTALSFRDLLSLPERIQRPLDYDGKDILLDTGHGPVPLSEQSDGYKTVLAFVLDILAGLPKSVHDKSTATGIVLIDELDSHLHPKWKMRIVRSLRRTFPKLQFISTTHEPLCLRGLGKGEITVMRKVENTVEIDDDLPSPEDLRIDQLLTSELFGLESTIDPVIDEKFYNYYQLLANSTESSNGLSETERIRQRDTLRRELQKYNTLGFTRRDQMVYDLIDTYLARKNGQTKKQQLKLLNETKKRVFEIWDLIKVRNE